MPAEPILLKSRHSRPYSEPQPQGGDPYTAQGQETLVVKPDTTDARSDEVVD